MTRTSSNAFSVQIIAPSSPDTFPLYSLYAAIVTFRGGTPIPESNDRYWGGRPSIPAGGSVHQDVSSLNAALISAQPGSVHKLAAGTYTGETITIPSGTDGVTVCAEQQGAVHLKGSSRVVDEGDGNTILGLDFSDTENNWNGIFRLTGNDSVVALNTLRNLTTNEPLTSRQWFVLSGARHRVCFNTLDGRDSWGVYFFLSTPSGVPYCRLDHNHLLNHRGIETTGAGEIAQIGQTQHDVDYFALFDHNYIFRHNNDDGVPVHTDRELFTNKSRSNMWIQNVARECSSFFNDRTARWSTYYANWIFGDNVDTSGGIHGGGDEGLRACNYIANTNRSGAPGGAALEFGGGSPTPYVGSQTYKAADNTEAAFNTLVNVNRCITFNRTGLTYDPDGVRLHNNAVQTTGTADVIWNFGALNASNLVLGGNVMGPNDVGLSDPGIVATEPELTQMQGYSVPTPGGNCDGSGVEGFHPLITVDILGNPIPSTDPHVGCIQPAYDLSVDPVQAIIDSGGA